jgi:Skp family chaperone for outer membrane proteins
VKKFLSWATLVAVFAAGHVSAPEAAAQQRGPAQAVAIVDLTYIFANHVRFKALVEDMRRDVEAAEADLKASKESIEKLAENLDSFNKNSPEYKELEETFASRQAELQVKVNIQKRNFMEQEAKIYLQIYREVLDHVKYHAEKSGLSLVLRFNGDPVDGEDLQGVMQQLNRQVVYYNRTIDITPIVLDACNAASGRPNRQPTGPLSNKPSGLKPQGVPPRR